MFRLLRFILGSEPAALLAVVQSGVALFVALANLDPLTAGVVGTTVTAVLGLLVAWATENTRLTAAIELAKTLLAAAVFFQVGGVHLTPQHQAAIVAFLTLAGGFLVRQLTSAAPTAISKPSLGYLWGRATEVGEAVYPTPGDPHTTDEVDDPPVEAARPGDHRAGSPVR